MGRTVISFEGSEGFSVQYQQIGTGHAYRVEHGIQSVTVAEFADAMALIVAEVIK